MDKISISSLILLEHNWLHVTNPKTREQLNKNIVLHRYIKHAHNMYYVKFGEKTEF